MYSTISADIVSSTKLDAEDTINMKEVLARFLSSMEVVSPGSWGRIIKGDAVECVLERPHDALRVALMLKCAVKSYVPKKKNKDFSRYGVRIAIAIGDLRINDRENGIIDGYAIYASGRTIEDKTMVSKGTMQVLTQSASYASLDVVAFLADSLINKATDKQCAILFQKLMRKSEKSIAESLGKKVPTINAHSQKAAWPAISKALDWFETTALI